MTHILTNRGLAAGGIPMGDDHSCLVCGHKGDQVGTYVGVYCPKCGSLTGNMNQVIEARRRRAGLSRKQAAAEYGVKTATIRRYEWSGACDKYEQFTRRWIAQPQPLNRRRDG